MFQGSKSPSARPAPPQTMGEVRRLLRPSVRHVGKSIWYIDAPRNSLEKPETIKLPLDPPPAQIVCPFGANEYEVLNLDTSHSDLWGRYNSLFYRSKLTNICKNKGWDPKEYRLVAYVNKMGETFPIATKLPEIKYKTNNAGICCYLDSLPQIILHKDFTPPLGSKATVVSVETEIVQQDSPVPCESYFQQELTEQEVTMHTCSTHEERNAAATLVPVEFKRPAPENKGHLHQKIRFRYEPV